MPENFVLLMLFAIFVAAINRRGARVVEEARLESVYAVSPHREFESLPLRKICISSRKMLLFKDFGLSCPLKAIYCFGASSENQ